ncbi:MAG: carotenoid 1,2-hydratase [Rhodocyclaceae bacterium]|nr:carotenoid 1,2-hydratase [Rhodocyclaceae bacterium]
MPRRRAAWLLALALAGLAPVPGRAAGPAFAAVVPGAPLSFPRDHGAHPDFRTEWWYVTGWLDLPDGRSVGFQVTFFRTRTGIAPGNPSRFAPHQLVFAHAALADPAVGRLRHDQRAARAGFGLAEAAEGDTRLVLDGWTLDRRGRTYAMDILARDFRLALEAEAAGPPLLQGEAGFSRKGPRPAQASWYYSRPQLAVRGRLAVEGRETAVTGRAWLDHEWSSELLDEAAVGWDWAGINLDDGGALTVFRLRDARGNTRWAGGSRRWADGRQRAFAPGELAFEPRRHWQSPRGPARYPVEMAVTVAGPGGGTWLLSPLLDDQELDARASTGNLYWEGAVTALRDGRPVGRGYLELTGYGTRLRM